MGVICFDATTSAGVILEEMQHVKTVADDINSVVGAASERDVATIMFSLASEDRDHDVLRKTVTVQNFDRVSYIFVGTITHLNHTSMIPLLL